MIAIIYTGQTRTIETVIDTFKNNIHGDIYAVLETDNVNDYDNYIKEKLAHQLKSLTWFQKNEEWITIRDKLLNNMDLTPNINDHGIIKFYQLSTNDIELKNMNDYTLKLYQKLLTLDWYDYLGRRSDQ